MKRALINFIEETIAGLVMFAVVAGSFLIALHF